VTALEGELATKDQALSQAEQRISNLTKELDQEKKSGEQLNSELSLKIDLVTEFQQKLQTSQANQQALEKTVIKSIKEIAALQGQLEKLKAQQIPTESSPAIVDVKKEPPSKSEAIAEQDESPSPNDLIDWVFKKKEK
jgi:chromosome segregation ATPase